MSHSSSTITRVARCSCDVLLSYLRVKFVALVGLTAAILIDVGGAVWWKLDWMWKLYQAFYDFSVWVVVGLVLAKFIEPKTVETTASAAGR